MQVKQLPSLTFKAEWLLYAPPYLTFQITAFYPHAIHELYYPEAKQRLLL
jgi:hypothetical protein